MQQTRPADQIPVILNTNRPSIWMLFLMLLMSLFYTAALAQPKLYRTTDEPINFNTIKSRYGAEMESLRYLKGAGFKPYKRWEHYWQYRVHPDGTFPSVHEIKKDWQSYLSKNAVYKIANTSNWTSRGPTEAFSGYSGIGRVNRLTFVPNNPSIIYASTPGGGLWKTTNRGANWAPLTDYLPSIGSSGLIIDHANTSVMYLATGDADGSNVYSIGVLKSTNSGQSWNDTGLKFETLQGMLIYSLVQHPVNPSMLLAGTNRGLYRTADAGTTWTKVQETGTFYDLEFKPGNPNVVYAGIVGGVMRSTDAGVTWSTVYKNDLGRRTAIAVSPANPDLIAALIVNTTNGFLGFFASTNSGEPETFVQKSSTPNVLSHTELGSDNRGQGWYDLALTISPTDANQVWVGGVNIWKSLDGGVTWTHNTHWYRLRDKPEVHADQHELVFQDGQNLFVANDGGVYFTSDGGAVWQDISNGLVITQMYAIAISQSDDKVLIGTQDNGTKMWSTLGWTDELGGDGMQNAIDPNDSNILYGSLYYGAFYRSMDGGTIWKSIRPDTIGGAWVAPFVLDPTTPSTIYAGMRTLYKSLDRGDTWTNISPGLTNDRTLGSIAVAPTSPNTIYVSWYNQGSKLAKTMDGGQSWITLTPPHTSNITSISFDPKEANTVYLTFSNYDYLRSKVYRSKDGGLTWTNISDNLPNVPANILVHDKTSNGGMYLGMDVGVFYRDNTMSNWVLYNRNLPNVEIFDLEIHHKDRKLVAGTYGRGLWESPLYTSTTSIAQEDEVPQTYRLNQNYPNPFNPTTTITFEVPQTSELSLKVYDLTGRLRQVLAQGSYTTGTHSIQWDASKLPSGLYVYQLSAGSHTLSRKMTLVK